MRASISFHSAFEVNIDIPATLQAVWGCLFPPWCFSCFIVYIALGEHLGIWKLLSNTKQDNKLVCNISPRVTFQNCWRLLRFNSKGFKFWTKYIMNMSSASVSRICTCRWRILCRSSHSPSEPRSRWGITRWARARRTANSPLRTRSTFGGSSVPSSASPTPTPRPVSPAGHRSPSNSRSDSRSSLGKTPRVYPRRRYSTTFRRRSQPGHSLSELLRTTCRQKGESSGSRKGTGCV